MRATFWLWFGLLPALGACTAETQTTSPLDTPTPPRDVPAPDTQQPLVSEPQGDSPDQQPAPQPVAPSEHGQEQGHEASREGELDEHRKYDVAVGDTCEGIDKKDGLMTCDAQRANILFCSSMTNYEWVVTYSCRERAPVCRNKGDDIFSCYEQ